MYRTSGWRAWKGVVRLATMGSAVGMAAMRRCPVRPRFSASTSCRSPRASETIRLAHSRTRSPSWVKPRNREPRRTSMTPSVSSSCLRPAERVGCVTPHASAARPKCFSCAMAIRNSSLSIIRTSRPQRSITGRAPRRGAAGPPRARQWPTAAPAEAAPCRRRASLSRQASSKRGRCGIRSASAPAAKSTAPFPA